MYTDDLYNESYQNIRQWCRSMTRHMTIQTMYHITRSTVNQLSLTYTIVCNFHFKTNSQRILFTDLKCT